MVEWTKEDPLFFNNLAKVEEEFYKVNEAIANGSGDMKTQIASLFETLRSVSIECELKYFENTLGILRLT